MVIALYTMHYILCNMHYFLLLKITSLCDSFQTLCFSNSAKLLAFDPPVFRDIPASPQLLLSNL